MKIKLAVIGDPISHSKSPQIHTAVLEELGLDYEYECVRVQRGSLEEFISYAKEKGFRGFNVTMPHKIDIIPFLDWVDDEAKMYNSVNTVKIEDGKLYGYNTDGKGYLESIKEKGFLCEGKNIVILGAGGAAATVAMKAAASFAASVTVLNRSRERSQRLYDNIKDKTGVEVFIDDLSTENIAKHCKNCDLLINGTPLGMHGIEQNFDSFEFFNSLKKGALVSDMIYNPPKTEFLKNAEKNGFEILNGLGMLIYQGLIADEIFLEKSIDFKDLKDKIKNNIEKIEK